MITTKLRLKLAEKGISQSELARETGIRQPAISAYCNNTFKQISKEHLDTLCKYFECDVSDILIFKDTEKEDDLQKIMIELVPLKDLKNLADKTYNLKDLLEFYYEFSNKKQNK